MMNQGVFQGQYTHSYTDTNNFLSIKVKGYGLNFHLHFDEHMEVTEDVPLPKFIKSMLQVPVVEKRTKKFYSCDCADSVPKFYSIKSRRMQPKMSVTQVKVKKLQLLNVLQF